MRRRPCRSTSLHISTSNRTHRLPRDCCTPLRVMRDLAQVLLPGPCLLPPKPCLVSMHFVATVAFAKPRRWTLRCMSPPRPCRQPTPWPHPTTRTRPARPDCTLACASTVRLMQVRAGLPQPLLRRPQRPWQQAPTQKKPFPNINHVSSRVISVAKCSWPYDPFLVPHNLHLPLSNPFSCTHTLFRACHFSFLC